MKHARLVRKLTIRELADSVGCSPSHISKIENNKLRPSLAMLHRLATALDVNIDSLFNSNPAEGSYSLIRARDAPVIRVSPVDDETGIEIFRLIPDTASALLEAHIHHIEPGADSDGTMVHPGEELGFVLQGEVEMTIGGETFVAQEGDCFYYNAELNHGYSNRSEQPAKILWVCTPNSNRDT